MDYNDKTKELEEAKRELTEIENSKGDNFSNESDVERGDKVKLNKKIVIIVGVTLMIVLVGVSALCITQLHRLNVLTSNNKTLLLEIEKMSTENKLLKEDKETLEKELEKDTKEDVERNEQTREATVGENRNEVPPPNGNVDSIQMDTESEVLIYVKHEVVEDYQGEPALLVYFEYTNKRDKPSTSSIYPQLFQDGVECDSAVIRGNNESKSNRSKDIQKGVTIDIAQAFSLRSDTDGVLLRVQEGYGGNYQEQVLSLKDSSSGE